MKITSTKLILIILLAQCLFSSHASENLRDSFLQNTLSPVKSNPDTNLENLPDLCLEYINSHISDEDYLNLSEVNRHFQKKFRNDLEKLSYISLKNVYKICVQNTNKKLSLKWFKSTETFVHYNKIQHNLDCLELQYLYCLQIPRFFLSLFPKKNKVSTLKVSKVMFNQFRQDFILNYLKRILPDMAANTYINNIDILFTATNWSNLNRDQKRTPAESFFVSKITTANQEQFFRLACIFKKYNLFDQENLKDRNYKLQDIINKQHKISKNIFYVLAFLGNLDAQYLLRSLKSDIFDHPFKDELIDQRKYIIVDGQKIYFAPENLASKGYTPSLIL